MGPQVIQLHDGEEWQEWHKKEIGRDWDKKSFRTSHNRGGFVRILYPTSAKRICPDYFGQVIGMELEYLYNMSSATF